MTHEFVLEPTVMKDTGDCSLCCLKMITERSYPDVFMAVPRRIQKTVTTDGMTTAQVILVARRLGVRLEYHDAPEEDDVGILDLERAEDGHMVMYLKGGIYNPADGLFYTDDSIFLARGGWTVAGFLKRVE